MPKLTANTATSSPEKKGLTRQMTSDNGGCDVVLTGSSAEYKPPTIEVLGTLADLTQGGTTGPSDVTLGAGELGSL